MIKTFILYILHHPPHPDPRLKQLSENYNTLLFAWKKTMVNPLP